MRKPKVQKIRKRNGDVVDFKPEKITEAIWAAAQSVGGKDRSISEKLTADIVKMLERKYDGEGIPAVEHVQDIVEKALIEQGHAKTAKAYILYREQRKNIREVSKLLRDITIVDDYIEELDWRVRENSNMTYSLQGLNVHITSKVISNYWLNSVYPKEVRDAHVNGEFHIHDLGTLGPYTYFGKESVIAKLDGRLLVTSFQRLYDSLKERETLLSKADDVWVKYPKKLMVLDGKGWTKATRLLKKARKKKMHFIKNEGGRSVIVTDDHPMIVNKEGETKAAKLVKEKDNTLTVNLGKLMVSEKLFQRETIFLAEELVKRGIDDFWVDAMPLEEYSRYSKDLNANVMVSANNNANVLPNRIKLTENLGYLVGYCLAEGSVDTHKLKIKQKRTASNKKAFERLKKAAHGLGCRLYARDENGMTTLDIANTTFVKYLVKEVFTCGGISREKMLPEDVLSYNKKFVKGLLAGLIDGDGSINSSATSIDLRTSSRTMLEQMATVLNLLGFVARDRNIEGAGTVREFKGRRIVQNYPLFGIGFRKLKGNSLPSFKYGSAGLSSKAWRAEGAGWHKILNNEVTKITDKYIYDITTDSSTLVVNGMWNHNCVGWDLEDLLMSGFRGVRGKIESKPAKHFDVALMQIVNFMYTLQGEAAGAQALSNFDTLLAPFIRVDGLDYKKVKQSMQKFLFNMNVPTRVGFQTPFTNITMDLTPPSFFRDKPVIMGGKPQDTTYGDYQKEMDMLNRAFAETMLDGDASGRPFTFPIPTYNVTKDFPWDKEDLKPLWEMSAKYGIPYFSNFINSDMKPEDARSMCCRLRLDNRVLQKRGGGLFGANPLTGSVGVVTLNLPRIAYEAEDEKDFFEILEERMELAKESLIIKRKILEEFTESGLYPYSKFYLRGINESQGRYWKNHFSTIGVIGMNDALLNFSGHDITEPEGKEFALKIMDFMREKLLSFQDETGDIFNLEATPAEGTSYRLARIDRKLHPKIKVYNLEKHGNDKKPYYTNSTQLPVGHTDDIFEALEKQDALQTKYSGGTVLHGFIGEKLPSVEATKNLVRTIAENFHLPYFTLTPTFSICPCHGYIAGEHEYCPTCDQESGINTVKGGK